jgi:hypothetical protein
MKRGIGVEVKESMSPLILAVLFYAAIHAQPSELLEELCRIRQ